MNIKNNIYLLLVLIAAICLFNCSIIFGGTEEKEFNKTIPFIEGGTIYLKNTTGEVTIESWDKEKVEINALIKVKGEYADEVIDKVKININPDNRHLEIIVKYPDKEDYDIDFWDWIKGKRKPNISVSFQLRIPYISDVDISLVTGSISVDKIKGAVDVETVTGSISIQDIAGNIDTKTVTGSISLQNIDGSIDAKTVTGDIKVLLPENINADLSAELVTGKIHTDFHVKIKGNISKKRIDGVINDGGPLINLETVTGSIRLLSLK